MLECFVITRHSLAKVCLFAIAALLVLLYQVQYSSSAFLVDLFYIDCLT